LGRNGRNLVKTLYSWDKICKDMLAIYPHLAHSLPET